MANSTSFLSLVLPELGEFVNSWNEPLNQNFEDIDEWLEDLHDNLVAVGSGSTWAALRGSLDSLAERLDVSINADGTLDVSNSPDILDIATSAYRGQFTGPRDRLNDVDREFYNAGQAAANGRFTPMAPSGPSAGFPHEEIDSGIAIRSADFGAHSAEPISSPQRPWAPGLIVGGADPFVTANAVGQVRLNAGNGALFNIDGYLFRIREDIIFDYSLLSPNDLDYVWLYVQRGDYSNANFQYDGPGGGGVAVKDLRELQSGSAGQTSGSTFQDAGASFNTAALGKVKSGDILVIESGAAAGSYVINALDGTTPDTKLTIKGTFFADVSGVPWHIQDDWHPNVGAFVTDGATTTRPPFQAGRVYIGRFRHNAALNPDQLVTFQRGGVWDSGWIAADASSWPPTIPDHNLGAIPSSVDIWVRVDAISRAYRPMVQRQVLTNFDTGDTNVDPTDPKTATLLFPSMQAHVSETTVALVLLNASTDPAKPAALFTDSGGTDRITGQIRIIARR